MTYDFTKYQVSKKKKCCQKTLQTKISNSLTSTSEQYAQRSFNVNFDIFSEQIFHRTRPDECCWILKCRDTTALVLICQVLTPNVQVNIYLLKVSYKNTRKKCEICSKSTIKTPE